MAQNRTACEAQCGTALRRSPILLCDHRVSEVSVSHQFSEKRHKNHDSQRYFNVDGLISDKKMNDPETGYDVFSGQWTSLNSFEIAQTLANNTII